MNYHLKKICKYFTDYLVMNVDRDSDPDPDLVQLFRDQIRSSQKGSGSTTLQNYELYSYLNSWMSHPPIVFPHRLPPEIHK